MAEKQSKKKPNELLRELLGYYWPSSALWRTYEADLLQKINYPPPVLDIGCGPGFFSKSIFKKVEVGLDNGQEDLKVAEEINLYQKTHCCSAKKIPYPRYYFGTVFANCVLEHIPQPEKVISESARVLKKGGILVFTVPSENFSSMLLSKNKHYIAFRNNSLKHFNLYSVARWKEILNRFNLRLEKRIKYLDEITIKFWDLTEIPGFFSFRGKTLGIKIWEITPKWIWQRLLTKPFTIFLKRKPKKKNGANLLIARKL